MDPDEVPGCLLSRDVSVHNGQHTDGKELRERLYRKCSNVHGDIERPEVTDNPIVLVVDIVGQREKATVAVFGEHFECERKDLQWTVVYTTAGRIEVDGIMMSRSQSGITGIIMW